MAVNNVKTPLILKRMIIKSQGPNSNKIPLKPGKKLNHKLIKIPLYREDVIFESNGEKFLPGEYHSVSIINKLNNLTNNCKTIARCVTPSGEVIEKTSDNVTQLLGQESYNTVFYALCSVINQEYKIKGLLSLLTVKNTPEKEIVKDVPNPSTACLLDKSCQTDETRLHIVKKKDKRRVRKVLVPYVVKPDENKLKKVTIDPYNIKQSKLLPTLPTFKCTEVIENRKIEFNPFNGSSFKSEPVETNTDKEDLIISTSSSDNGKSLPDLGYLQDDNSNDSVKTFSTLHSFKTIPELLINPISIVDNVDRHTKENLKPIEKVILPNHPITLMDGTVIKVPFKPEDIFHIATKENLQFVDNDTRKKLLFHQMQIDYKYCASFKDEDGNLPIHLAVINDDVELLKRQCVVLKIRNQSVDILASNGLTALKLSLFASSASMCSILLSHGADPCRADSAHSSSLHLAAELRTDHLAVLLNHCKLNARDIILQHVEELQKEGWEKKSDEELSTLLLDYMCCSLFDKQGYLPVMLACKLGHYENVRLLLESSPKAVNIQMPNCGNTSLFLAVAAACAVAAERGNKSKVVDHFRKTIEILLDMGADPTIENHGGSNLTILLQEFNCAELSMLVANKLTYTKYFKGQVNVTKNFDKYILIKDGNNVSIEEIDSKSEKRKIKKEETKEKQVIVENILIKTPDTVDNVKVEIDSEGDASDVAKTSNVKKAIWYPLKRKSENKKKITINSKKPKVTK